jgi:hypothetical protein
MPPDPFLRTRPQLKPNPWGFGFVSPHKATDGEVSAVVTGAR